MKVLGRSVLGFEAIVVALGIPVAMQLGPTAGRAVTVWVGLLLVLVCLLATGLVGRPSGVAAGWVVQGLVIATAVVVPAMLVLGLVFAGLWWAAVHYGRRADALSAAARAPQSAAPAQGADPGDPPVT